MLMNTNVLVTGATGLIGSSLVKTLLDNGANVFAVGRRKEKLSVCFEEYLGEVRLHIIECDVSEKIPNIEEQIDYLFHAASPMEPGIIENTPVDVIEPNLLGTINCLTFLQQQKEKYGKSGRMIAFSSVVVYGNPTDQDYCVNETETRLTDFIEATKAPYSQSKRMTEIIARAYQKQYGIDIVIARLSTVYGYTKFKPNTAFYEFIDKSCAGEDIWVNSNTAPRRDNIYINDAVDGLLTIAEKGTSGEAYNISSNAELGNFAAVDEIAGIIADMSNEIYFGGKEISVNYRSEFTIDRTPGLILDNTKLKQLGWEVKTELREGITNVLKLYKNKVAKS